MCRYLEEDETSEGGGSTGGGGVQDMNGFEGDLNASADDPESAADSPAPEGVASFGAQAPGTLSSTARKSLFMQLEQSMRPNVAPHHRQSAQSSALAVPRSSSSDGDSDEVSATVSLIFCVVSAVSAPAGVQRRYFNVRRSLATSERQTGARGHYTASAAHASSPCSPAFSSSLALEHQAGIGGFLFCLLFYLNSHQTAQQHYDMSDAFAINFLFSCFSTSLMVSSSLPLSLTLTLI